MQTDRTPLVLCRLSAGDGVDTVFQMRHVTFQITRRLGRPTHNRSQDRQRVAQLVAQPAGHAFSVQ